jgi:hypothetical protein
MPIGFKDARTDSPIGDPPGIGENNLWPRLDLYYNHGSSDVLGKDFRPRSRSRSRPRFCVFDSENEDDDEDDVAAARAALCLSVFICG